MFRVATFPWLKSFTQREEKFTFPNLLGLGMVEEKITGAGIQKNCTRVHFPPQKSCKAALKK